MRTQHSIFIANAFYMNGLWLASGYALTARYRFLKQFSIYESLEQQNCAGQSVAVERDTIETHNRNQGKYWFSILFTQQILLDWSAFTSQSIIKGLRLFLTAIGVIIATVYNWTESIMKKANLHKRASAHHERQNQPNQNHLKQIKCYGSLP